MSCNTCSYKAFLLEWTQDQFLINIVHWPWQILYVHLETRNLMCNSFWERASQVLVLISWLWGCLVAWAHLAAKLTCSVCHPAGKPAFWRSSLQMKGKKSPFVHVFLSWKALQLVWQSSEHFCWWPSNKNCWMSWDGFIWSDFFPPCGFELSAVCWKIVYVIRNQAVSFL